MADIKLQIVNIKTVVNALLVSKALPDCFGLRSSQDFQGNNEYYLEVHIGKWESEDFTNYRDTTIELKIWDTEEELKAIIQVYDFPEVEDVNNYTPLLPFLKDYLKKHPLLQFPNYPRKYDNIEYYLSKSIPPEYSKEIYVALVVLVQDFFSDIVWYV